MTGHVRKLDDALINQIAAGEVVERPASVVKELVENALDAGAQNLHVAIEDGGKASIRVTDDGHGMSRANAEMAVQRHATSKLRAFEDLLSMHTLGFRGEALPSIASVSRFVMTTRVRDADAGTEVHIDGGQPAAIRDVGAAPGTTVEVSELFYNVPARRKFLKARQTETSHIQDICLRAALAHPTLRLTLLSNGRRTKEYLPSANRAERAQQMFPNQMLTELTLKTGGDSSADGMSVQALLGPPEKARSGARHLFLFVNGRPVKDFKLARAIAFAYGSVLPSGRYPSGVVFLELDTANVDVNAHPQKTEVRFVDERHVFDNLTRKLARRLGTQAWGKSPHVTPTATPSASPSASASSTPSPKMYPTGPAARSPLFWEERLGTNVAETRASYVSPSRPDEKVTPVSVSESVPKSSNTENANTDNSVGSFGPLRALGQMRTMFIIAEGAGAKDAGAKGSGAEGGLFVIDQHAADERIVYGRLKRGYAAKDVAVQRLLFPERVEVSAQEAALVEEAREDIALLGLDCNLVGTTTVAVHTVPAVLKRAKPEQLLHDLLGELTKSGPRAFGDAIDMALATMACHSALRAGDALSVEECQALLHAMDQVADFRGHCPHGRPVVFQIPFTELARRVGR